MLFIYFIPKASTKVALTLLGLEGRSCRAPPDHPSSLSPRVCPEEPETQSPFCLYTETINIKTSLPTPPRSLHSRPAAPVRPAWPRAAAAALPARPDGCERRPAMPPATARCLLPHPPTHPPLRPPRPDTHSKGGQVRGGCAPPPSASSSPGSGTAAPHRPCSVGVGRRRVQRQGLGLSQTPRPWPF